MNLNKMKMNKETMQRSIYMEKEIFDALGEQARYCGRTPLKQLRQILLHYFNLEPLDVDYDGIVRAQTRLGANNDSGRDAEQGV